MLARIRSVVVVSDAPPAAISFPSCRKRYGRKGALGYVWVPPASEFRRKPMFQASFHTIVTSRAAYCAPPDTAGIKFVTDCLRTTAINRRYARNFDECFLLAGPAPTTYNVKLCRKKVQPDEIRLHLPLMADILRQLVTNPIPPYQAARSKKLVR